MAPYLHEHPPASPQFSNRPVPVSGGVVVHTSEGPSGPGSALGLAGFISRRLDPGSYSCAVDTSEAITMVYDHEMSYSVAAGRYNEMTWNICLCGRSSEMSPDDEVTQRTIDQAAVQIAAFWGRNKIPANPQWIGTGVQDRAGIAGHGDIQPWDRSDPWTRHPQGTELWQLLFDRIRFHLGEETEMRDAIIRDPRSGAVYRITQPGNVAVHLSPPAYADVMIAVRAGIVADLGEVSPATLGNFGILPSILEVKG